MDDEGEIKKDTKLQAATQNELDKYLNEEEKDKVPMRKAPVISPLPPIQNMPKKEEEISENQTLKNLQTNSNPLPEKKEIVKPIIRTYKSDLEETIRSQHLSSINIALAENKKMMQGLEQSRSEEVKEKSNYVIFIVSALLIVGGILAFVIPYFLVNKENIVTTEPIVVESPLLVADTVDEINIDSLNISRIARTLGERADQVAVKLGSIKQFYMTTGVKESKRQVTSKEFLSLIQARVPSALERTIKDQYIYGIHGFNGNQKFLILKIGSYETAYSGMLSWEVGMWQDFRYLFNLYESSPLENAEGVSKSADGEVVKNFQDVVIKNKDTRAVKTANGEIIFLYSVIDKNTIVITTSPDTFKEIMNRLDKLSVSR